MSGARNIAAEFQRMIPAALDSADGFSSFAGHIRASAGQAVVERISETGILVGGKARQFRVIRTERLSGFRCGDARFSAVTLKYRGFEPCALRRSCPART